MRAAHITGPGRATLQRVMKRPSFESRWLQWTLSSGGARRRRFWLATKAPGQVAGRHVGNHCKQHQEYGDPKNPTVMHSLPARAMRMIAVVLMIVFCLIHRFLAFHFCLPKRGVSLR